MLAVDQVPLTLQLHPYPRPAHLATPPPDSDDPALFGPDTHIAISTATAALRFDLAFDAHPHAQGLAASPTQHPFRYARPPLGLNHHHHQLPSASAPSGGDTAYAAPATTAANAFDKAAESATPATALSGESLVPPSPSPQPRHSVRVADRPRPS